MCFPDRITLSPQGAVVDPFGCVRVPAASRTHAIMPYLRCDACGAKALPIATRCPSCELPFPSDVGGTRAAALGRMQACGGCDSLLPQGTEACRWCGELVGSRAGIRWRIGLAAGLLLLLAGGGVHLATRDADVIRLAAPETEVAMAPPAAAPPAPAPLQEPTPPRSASASRSSTTAPPAPAPAPPSATPSTPLAGPDPVAPDPATPDPIAPDRSPPVRAMPAVPLPEAATPGDGWVRAVARTFVNIRTAPDSDASVQGVVAENDVVFLGDARGAWRQIRSGSVLGWVWEPLFQVGSEGP